MSTATRPGPFATKPTEQLIEAAEGTRLNRAVGALDLTALGIGAIIGTGIFVIIGEAIAESGPALVISFLLAGITCVFSASPTRSSRRRFRCRALPIRMPTRPWARPSRGSSGGI
jgi:hypothetical protein